MARFKEGDHVVVVSPSGLDHDNYGRVGDTAVVLDADSDWIRVKWDNDGRINTPRIDRFKLVASADTDSFKVVHHCFTVTNSGTNFDKLGDFTMAPNRIEKYLFEYYGSGVYLVKQKNEKRGRIFTIKRPNPKPYEVTEGGLLK